MDIIELSRIQFGFTAMYHFVFVPLSIGLMLLIAILETFYIVTKNKLWQSIAIFWSKFFLINWVFGILTGIVLRLQLAYNWTNYSAYIESLSRELFAIETYISPFLFGLVFLFVIGWKRFNPYFHWVISCLLVLILSAQSVTILTLNAWMMNPVGVELMSDNVKLISLSEVFLNPIVLNKVAHSLFSASLLASVFIISISAWFLLKKESVQAARTSLNVAIILGFFMIIATIISGHKHGQEVAHYQPMKFAALEAMWNQVPSPAPLILFTVPDAETQTNNYTVEIPYLLGLMITHSWNKTIPGIQELVEEGKQLIRYGLLAYRAMQQPDNSEMQQIFEKYRGYLGYAMLLQTHIKKIENATEEDITQAAHDLVPNVTLLFWSFRIMVACGLILFLLCLLGIINIIKKATYNRGFLLFALLSLPLPWIATYAGWLLTETGRQPWTVVGMLPTLNSGGNLEPHTVFLTLMFLVMTYTALFILYVFLNIKYISKRFNS
jgi:cytochrome d ubiquinol oxidase subunit I